MKALLNISFNPSDAPNVDISCFKCNQLKDNLADVPFVWKLKYLQKHNISLKSQRSLERTLTFYMQEPIGQKQRDIAIQCIYRGDIRMISPTACRFVFRHSSVFLEEGKVTEVIQQKEKYPRKLKKQAKDKESPIGLL